MKPLVIYHASCADGFGAAFAAWLKLGDDAEYFPCQYNTEAHLIGLGLPIVSGREVYILDFSFPRDRMDYIFANAKCVVWLDHHKTALDMWLADKLDFPFTEFITEEGKSFATYGSNVHIQLNNWKSGAILAWEYFHPGAEVPQFIRHIDDYDRWQFKLHGTKAFQKALWSYAPWSFKQWQHEWDTTWGYSSADGLEGIPNTYREGEAILRAHDQNVQAVVKGSTRVCTMTLDRPVADYHGLATNCPPHLTSDVGHVLATQSGTFGLCWTLSQTGLIAKCSLRSNGEYDVSAIAKAFGGGGHRNAAGFEVPIQTLLRWLK